MPHNTPILGIRLFTNKGENKMKTKEQTKKKNPYATMEGGMISAPHAVKDKPKATTIRGNDLRQGK